MLADAVEEFILCFKLGKLTIGLKLCDIDCVLRAVQISPLPGAPPIVLGMINLRSIIIPILNFRKRFGMRNKSISTDQKLIIIKIPEFHLGFFADDIIGLQAIDKDAFSHTDNLLPGSDTIIEGIVVLENEMVLIHDVKTFLSLNEKEKLRFALNSSS